MYSIVIDQVIDRFVIFVVFEQTENLNRVPVRKKLIWSNEVPRREEI